MHAPHLNLTAAAARLPLSVPRLPNGAAFALQVSIVMAFLAGSSAPTPLYAVYQSEWGFSPITVTVVFGVYAVAALAALLTVGSLSDFVGRRPVLLSALALQAVAMLVFATAGGVTELLVARTVQGASTGAALGALGAGLLDLHRAKGTRANGISPLVGVATGALGSSLLVQYLPAPTTLVYLVLLGIFALQAVGVAVMPESAARQPGAVASLKPQVGIPGAVRRPLLMAGPALIAVWALVGFYLSLGPALARFVAGSHSSLLGGLTVFAFAASAAVTVVFVEAAPARRAMLLGTASLAAGVGLTLLAASEGSIAGFYLGTAVAGIGIGSGFNGVLRTLLPLVQPHERASVLSTIYVTLYLAMGFPAVIAGYLVTHGDVLTTSREYGGVVMALALVALAGLVARRPERSMVPAGCSGCPAAS
jgi:MFS family permease